MKVVDLLPGDEVPTIPLAQDAARTAVYITDAPHPLYPGFRLVIWRLSSGEWSHDALLADQEVGRVTPSKPSERVARLTAALLGPGVIR